MVNLHELEEEARAVLPKMVYDYFAGGAADGITLRRNRDAYDVLSLRYRVLRDITERSIATEVCGELLPHPVIIAPTAFHRLASPEGELATARAASRTATPYVSSMLATVPIEDVTRVCEAPVWFQLYVFRDRAVTQDIVRRAEEAGCRALVLTVDAQIWGKREADIRNGFQLPTGTKMENVLARGQSFPENAQGSGLAAYVHSLFDPGLTWRDVEWLCSITSLPVMVKGIVRGDDGAMAVQHGAAGVIVSNHGGRQLDTSPATIEALEDVVRGVNGGADVMIDGGIRRGTDVIKALALGAKAVGIGRPILWGLAVGAEEGVVQVLDLLLDEVDNALGLCGAASVAELTPDLIAKRGAAL